MEMFDGPWQSCFGVRGLEPSECASWVQAWGSIAAVLMAGFVVWLGHHLQQRARARENFNADTQFLETLFQLIGGVRRVAEKIVKAESAEAGATPDERTTMQAELSALADAIKRIDLARLDRYEYVEAWLICDGLTRKLMGQVNWVSTRTSFGAAERKYLSISAGESIKTLDERGKVLHDAIAQRGGPPKSWKA